MRPKVKYREKWHEGDNHKDVNMIYENNNKIIDYNKLATWLRLITVGKRDGSKYSLMHKETTFLHSIKKG